MRFWLVLSVINFVLYYILWYIIDVDTFMDGGFPVCIVALEFAQCMLFTAVTLIASSLVLRLPFTKNTSYCYVLGTALLTLGVNLCVAFALEWIDERLYPTNADEYRNAIYIVCFLSILVSVINIALFHFERIAVMERSKLNLKQIILRKQLEPHFLFNSLSTIIGVIDQNPRLAEDYVIKLSGLYRSMVEQLNQDTSTLGKEIAFLKQYCDLMNIRFPNHFRFHFDDASLTGADEAIMPLALQLLIENAIKHNHHSATEPLEVNVYRKEHSLIVENQYREKQNNAPDSLGVGLANLKELYQMKFGLNISIKKTDYRFIVKIPLVQI